MAAGATWNTGAACPGLIEAKLVLRQAKANLDPNTGAACPGLIEAEYRNGIGNIPTSEYRGSLPRPH